MLIRPAMICYALAYTLAATLIFCTPAQAAPAGEATTTAEGFPATLEISQLGADFANTIQTDFAAIDLENAQPYASTEVDTEAELAPTSLPMTNEEMALAEVAAVVAELTTTTAAEMKSKEQAMQIDGVEELIRRRAEEARRQTIEHGSANVVEGLEDVTVNGKDLFTATTFRGSFADIIETTTAHPITVAGSTTTESPAILNELVRAAAAANEILAAALNVATMANTNTNAITATTTTKPEAATNTEAAVGDGPVAVIGSAALPETKDSWQPKEIETTNKVVTTMTLNTDTTEAQITPITTIISEITQRETTPNANISNEINSDNFLAKSLASEELEASVASRQKTTATGIQVTSYDSKTIATPTTASGTDSSKLDEGREIQNDTVPAPSMDLTALLEQFKHITDNEETQQTGRPLDNEAVESKEIIITTQEAAESTDTTPLSDGNEVESEITTIKAIKDEGTQIGSSNKQEAADSSTTPSEEPQLENAIQAAEFEIANVTEVKPEILSRENEGVESAEDEITATTTVADELTQTTTEPLETLIAIESEARAPNKIISPAAEVGAEVAAISTPIPELKTTTEPTAYATAAAVAATPIEGEERAESIINLAVVVPTPAPEEHITTTTPSDVDNSKMPDIKTELEITTATTNEVIVPISESKQDAKGKQQTTFANATEGASIKADGDDKAFTATTEMTTATKELPGIGTQIFLTEGSATLAGALPNGEETTNVSAETIEMITKSENATTHPVAQAQETTLLTIESALSSTDVPLAAFTTTPALSEQHLHAEAATRQGDFAVPSVSVSTTNVQVTESGTETAIHDANSIPTTLTSSTTATTPATADSTTLESESIILATPATATGAQTESATFFSTEKMEAETLIPTEQKAAITEAAVEEQPLYMRTLSAQQQAAIENGSKIETTTVHSETATITKAATTIAAEVKTITEPITTAGSTEAASKATVSTSVATKTTTTTTPEPETTTSTKSTITTTSTLSPMGLIIAEHEARSLESTPPRVSRIVSDDGIEVLSGYSIVHHMHAAALAALAAEEA